MSSIPRLNKLILIPTKGYAARFLIKFLEPEKDENETVEEQKAPYKWLFLSFSVLWLKKAGKVTCVVACYDDCGRLRDKIEEALARYPLRYLESNPFAIYDAFLRLYIWQYDEGIWKFRKPVRKIEKVDILPPNRSVLT